MLDQWKKRQKRALNISNKNLLTLGEERYVVRARDLLGVLCRDRGVRCGAAINKQLIKADTEQTEPKNNNNDLLQSYLNRQAPGHMHTHRHRKPDEEGV